MSRRSWYVYSRRKNEKPILPLETAQENRPVIEWRKEDLPLLVTGVRVVTDVSLADLVPFIDWTFFFTAWELKGTFPKILEHPKYGEAARELFDNARALLDQIVEKQWLEPRGIYGFWPANSEGDDVVVRSSHGHTRFPMLRQQAAKAGEDPYFSLSDFVAPKETQLDDHIGAFAVSCGHGTDELVARFEADHDDYSAIVAKALADRLAEAYAEFLHQRARRDWGYGADEQFTNDELIAEKYRGIRPAYGYPACPDHTEKVKLFGLLGAKQVGIELTESMAMLPAASVSGLYFAHPKSRYFTVGRLGRDQVVDYAKRKEISLEEAERWLRPNLGYDPDSNVTIATPLRTSA